MNILRNRRTLCRLYSLALVFLWAMRVSAHPITFNSSMTYSKTQPAAAPDHVVNWTGAAIDAANIGGSGINTEGGADNGIANDAFTYVANNQPVQGQTFLTGSAAGGYELNALTVRMAGYSNNNVSSSNYTVWNLHEQNGPIILTICELNGTSRTVCSMQNFKAGEVGNPGSGTDANGPGDYITFHLPFTTYLQPDTTYGFELAIGNGGANFFEWLGSFDTNTYPGGTAYHPNGGTINPLPGDHVFQADMTALASAPTGFFHPGALHTQADLDRMKARIAGGEEPWRSGYNMLLSSPYNNLGWPAYDVDWIVRGVDGSNYTRCQQDAQLIYTLTLLWHLTGDAAYADRAVYIAGVWSDLIGVTGNSNLSLAAGICGYLFATSGELLSTYPGWDDADKQAYKDMMMRVFYPANFDFLWRKHDTVWREGGNTHYRLNWETCNMASMAAIGILCDNRAVYEQAVDVFKFGPGVGRIERAAWYMHPDGMAQTEEIGRDQGHNLGGWYSMALLCQMAWNQGDDLFGYDNNRVLRALEHTTKWNLWNEMPVAFHSTCDSDMVWAEGLSWAGRGTLGMFHELVYNHYVNIKGIAAPYNEIAAGIMRPEPWPNTANHPSAVDWFGLGTLTFSVDPLTQGMAPAGLAAQWSKNRVLLSWNGTAHATNYIVERAAAPGGPYTEIGNSTLELYFTDASVVNDTTYHYKVSAETPTGTLESEPLSVAQTQMTRYDFDGSADDAVGSQNGTRRGGSTGLPGYATGKYGQAIDLDGIDDFVQLPVGVANYEDITLAAWVLWEGGGNWQRIFDFGSEIEKSMFLTPSTGGNMRFSITTSRGLYGSASLNGPVLSVGQWTHVAVTLNGDTGTLYVNGVPVDVQVVDLVDPLFGQIFCYIGKSMYNADPLFNGCIDDFRIYNQALSGDEIYTLWGQSGNSPPRFDSDLIDRSATEDNDIGQSITATDADGGTPSYAKVTGPAWLSVAADGSLSGTPANDAVGENIFVVRATDASGATDDATLRVTVANSNDAPFWTADPIDGGTNLQGTVYSFSAGGFAADDDTNDSLSISKISGPAWLNVAMNGILSGIPGASDTGINNFTLRVTDQLGANDDAVVKVYVLPGTTMAYWIFEEGTVNTNASAVDVAGAYSGTVPDLSGNGYHASPWWSDSYVYRADTASSTVPQTGAANLLSVQNGNTVPSISTTGTDLAAWNPASWTIEAAFKWDGTGGYFKTIVGRDGNNAGAAPLYISQRGTALAVEYADLTDSRWSVESGPSEVIAGHWLALAAQSDGAVLSLYVKDITAGNAAYRLLGTQDLSSSTNPALSSGSGDGGDWNAGDFSFGRGLYDGGHTDRFFGHIDDVRFSTAALTPNQFLYSTPAPPAAPTSLAAVSADEQVALAWNTVAGAAAGYHVKRAVLSGGPYGLIDSPAGTDVVDSGLTNGTTYFYVVSASGPGGEGVDSVEVSAVPSLPISSNEFYIAGHTLSGGNNLSLTVTNSVLGHDYRMLASDSLTPPDWQPAEAAQAGTGAQLNWILPIEPPATNRYYKLDVQRR